MPHHVAAGALIGPLGMLIVHRRPDRRHFPGCWDFPGGHLEPGEDAAVALARELDEELGVTAVVRGEPQMRITKNAHTTEGLVLDLWLVSEWIGTPANLAPQEHDALRWVRAGDLTGLRFAHSASRDLIENTLLPPTLPRR